MTMPNSARRIVIDRKIKRAGWGTLVQWAVQNNYDTLVIPLRSFICLGKNDAAKLLKIAECSNLAIEAGAWDLSLFIPRSLFFFHRDMFRMDSGRRNMRYNFCPTNPQTIEYLKKRAFRLFKKAAGIMPDSMRESPVFHLWPDRGHENTWCSCPACRAFTPAEQNLIAVNSIADVLENMWPTARLSYLDLAENFPDNSGISAKNRSGISPRNNTFALKSAPQSKPPGF